jgi:hypothetical protein
MSNIDFKQLGLNLFRLALVAGIVVLASNNKEGWGWLVFILFCTL